MLALLFSSDLNLSYVCSIYPRYQFTMFIICLIIPVIL